MTILQVISDGFAVTDIFEFWAQIKRGQLIHPADAPVFARMDAEKHGFQLHCLPTCFNGRLKTAPVVLLFLSPGYDEDFDPIVSPVVV